MTRSSTSSRSRSTASNLTIVQAVANYEEARQIARSDRTGYLPTVGVLGSAQRSKLPEAQAIPGRGLTSSSYAAELQASWQPDFWGKLRRTVEADVAAAQADAADLASARLSTQGAVAQDYIGLRAADDQIRLLENAVGDYKRTVSITQNKYAVGVAARSDIITAQTQLDSTRAQLIGAGVQRAQLEHAIAVLLGKAPADFSIARRPDLGIAIPGIPAQMPSSLLERRPDVAAAERLAAAGEREDRGPDGGLLPHVQHFRRGRIRGLAAQPAHHGAVQVLDARRAGRRLAPRLGPAPRPGALGKGRLRSEPPPTTARPC